MATTLQARALMPALTVNDVKQSLKFYRDGLGFAVKEEMKDGGTLQGVMIEAGGASLGLSQDDFSKGRDRVKGVGMRLYWGPLGFTVTDPDGFKLTISNPS